MKEFQKGISSSIRLFLHKYSSPVFFILLLLVYIFLGYPEILFFPPQGIHFLRQTDCLAFVMHYVNHGMDFFRPGVYNLTSTDGRAACEFPLLYYITALVYKVTGEHEYILRLINVSIVSLGFFALFKMLESLLKDLTFALAFTFLFFSSTVLIYYTNNYLPDAPALGFTLMGWYFFFRLFGKNPSARPLIFSFIFFGIASLLKITYLIYPIAAYLVLFLLHNFSGKKYDFGKGFNLRLSVTSFVTVLAVLAWNYYVLRYNQVNHVQNFLNHAAPVWQLDAAGIRKVFLYISDYWYTKYYYETTLHVFALLFVSGLIFIRHADRRLLLISLFLLCGALAYITLFYAQFMDHDYYFITVIPALIFLVITSFHTLTVQFPRIFNHFLAKLALVALCILSLNYAQKKLVNRYENKDELIAGIGPKLEGCRQVLSDLGIEAGSRIIVIPDLTPNGGLYEANRPGWNVKDTTEASLRDFESYVLNGASFVLCTNQALLLNPVISRHVSKPVWENDRYVVCPVVR